MTRTLLVVAGYFTVVVTGCSGDIGICTSDAECGSDRTCHVSTGSWVAEGEGEGGEGAE